MFAATEATGEGLTPTVVGYGDIHAVAYDIEGEVAAARRLGNPEQEESAIELRRALYRGRRVRRV